MKMLSSRAAGSLSCVLAVLLWPASAFVHTACFDAGSAVRRLRGGSTAWGMSFMVLGMGGIVAVIFAWRLEMPENSDDVAASRAERSA